MAPLITLGISEAEMEQDEVRKKRAQEGIDKLRDATAHLNPPPDLAGISSYTAPGSEFSRPAGSKISTLRNNTAGELTKAMQASQLAEDVVIFKVSFLSSS